jgi:hypothetical protein
MLFFFSVHATLLEFLCLRPSVPAPLRSLRLAGEAPLPLLPPPPRLLPLTLLCTLPPPSPLLSSCPSSFVLAVVWPWCRPPLPPPPPPPWPACRHRQRCSSRCTDPVRRAEQRTEERRGEREKKRERRGERKEQTHTLSPHPFAPCSPSSSSLSRCCRSGISLPRLPLLLALLPPLLPLQSPLLPLRRSR